MFMTKHYCKDCFRSIVDDTAKDWQLLMSSDNMSCPCCGKRGPIVASYYKYGEHVVTPDGKRVVGQPRYVGLNPNYSFFENNYLYADVENYRG